MKELPTVDELVQLFINNGWKGKTLSDGCNEHAVECGEVCIIPALIKYSGEEFDFEMEEGLYDQVENIYDVKAYQLYCGFDSKKIDNKVSKLACDLRIKLEELGLMVD